MNVYFLAQSGTTLTDFVAGNRSYSIGELFNMGGFIMWPLLVLSMLAVFILFLCLVNTRKNAVLPGKLLEKSESYIRKRDFKSMALVCSESDSCFGRIMYVVGDFLQRNPYADIDEVKEVAAVEGARQAGWLTRQISWLSDIGALSPMLGLLGTVVGMMRTFFEISNGNFEGVKQMQMAGGVAEALITTAGGLLVGIPALLCYAYFRSRVHKRVADMEAAVTHNLSLIATYMHAKRTPGSTQAIIAEESLPRLDNDPISRRDVRGL